MYQINTRTRRLFQYPYRTLVVSPSHFRVATTQYDLARCSYVLNYQECLVCGSKLFERPTAHQITDRPGGPKTPANI